MEVNNQILKGDIYSLDFGKVEGTTIRGNRPVIIIQNNKGNLYSPNVIVSSITTKNSHSHIPTHVELEKGVANLYEDSIVMGENLFTVEKVKLGRYIGNIGLEHLKRINMMLKISLDL